MGYLRKRNSDSLYRQIARQPDVDFKEAHLEYALYLISQNCIEEAKEQLKVHSAFKETNNNNKYEYKVTNEDFNLNMPLC